MSRLLPLPGFKPSKTLPAVEVLVVGSGMAGANVAKELVDADLEVLCLELGPFQTIQRDFTGRKMFDELKVDIRRAMKPQGNDLYLTFRDNSKQVAQRVDYPMRIGVGGAGEHWGATAWRFYEEDFKLKSQVVDGLYKGIDLSDILQNEGGVIQDWPMSYADAEPFYEKVEYEMGVSGRAGVLSTDGTLDRSRAQVFDNRHLPDAADSEEGGNIFEAVRRKPYPFPPLRDNQMCTTFRKATLEMGLSSFHCPGAITSRPWTSELGVNRPECSYCSFCESFGCWNGSKTTPLSSIFPYLEKKKNFKIRTFCDVFRVNTIDAGNGIKMAKSVDYFDRSGAVIRQPANIIILAAFTWQNVRLLLNSGLDGNVASTGETFVGKYWRNRAQAGASIVFDNHVLNGYDGPNIQRRICEHFNGENSAEIKLKELLPKGQFFLRGGYIGASSQRLPISSLTRTRASTVNIVPPDMPGWGESWKEYLRKGFIRYMELSVQKEPLSYEDRFLDLDPTYKDSRGIPVCRLTNPVHENDRRMARFMVGKAGEILKQAAQMFGGGRIQLQDSVRMIVYNHDSGGTCMGSDPSTSVTNRYGQMWQVPNLFPVGSSLFPSVSGHNPTVTICMLASWVASAIAQKRLDLHSSEKFNQIGPEARRLKV